MPSHRNTPRIARIAAAALAATGLLLAGRRAGEIAADPSSEKDCGPENPAEQGSAPASGAPEAAAGLPWVQRGGAVNDASCLNRTAVAGVIRVTRETDVADALTYARGHGLKVSIAGVRHSMGGQAFARNALMLDMRGLNAIALDAAARTVTVGSGATWHDIQKILHPKFAVKAMQSTDIFTVGGSVSVNAHGMDHNAGAVGRTIRSMRVMLADGTIKTVGPAENADLFRLVLGGYGLFGVVLEVDARHHRQRGLCDRSAGDRVSGFPKTV